MSDLLSSNIDLFLTGMTFMLMLYTGLRSFQSRGRNYLNYAFYLLFLNLFFFLMYYVWHVFIPGDPCCDGQNHIASIFTVTQLLAYIFYFRFISSFLSLPVQLPGVHKLFVMATWISLGFIAYYLVVVYIFRYGWLANRSFELARMILIGLSVYAMYQAYKLKHPLTNFFIVGNSLYLILAIIAWIIGFLWQRQMDERPFWLVVFGGLQPAVIAESICFMLGLSYNEMMLEKEKRDIQSKLIDHMQKLATQQKEFSDELEEKVKSQSESLIRLQQEKFDIEKTLAINEERTRISRDMHDDLGSGLSAIHLLSNYVKENAIEKYPEFSSEIDKIRKSSEDLNESIREIIWSVNTNDDNLNALVLFIRRYGHELQDITKTNIHIHSEDPVPEIPLNGVQRKHVFLCVKEALNNALKHGKPSAISIYIFSDAEKKIAIRVVDNGGGFSNRDPIFRSTGNGLRNMKERMDDIGGVVEIESSGQGTEVRLIFKP